jgi:hypothetical protein
MKNKSKWSAMAFLIIFIFFEYFSDNIYSQLGVYSQYIFETVLIFSSILIVGNFLTTKQSKTKKPIFILGLILVSGFLARTVADQINLIIPFDIHNFEVMIFLLFIGPILEELLYRGIFIECLKKFHITNKLIIIASAALFSISHIRIINQIPNELITFVQYQGIYTLLLGAACAWLRINFSIYWSILGHLLFNLGFYLACLIYT